MAMFDLKTTADDIVMIEKSIKTGTPVSFLATNEYGNAYFITYGGGLLTIEDRYDSYEYPDSELLKTASGKILVLAMDDTVILSVVKLIKLREGE